MGDHVLKVSSDCLCWWGKVVSRLGKYVTTWRGKTCTPLFLMFVEFNHMLETFAG